MTDEQKQAIIKQLHAMCNSIKYCYDFKSYEHSFSKSRGEIQRELMHATLQKLQGQLEMLEALLS